MDAISKIIKRLDLFQEYLNFLEKEKDISFEEYQKFEKKAAIERAFQLCIECYLDIAELFISDLRLPQPEEHREALIILGKHKIISENLAEKLADAVGFRNILVHDYIKIDDKKAYDNLQNLDDFRQFEKEVKDYLS